MPQEALAEATIVWPKIEDMIPIRRRTVKVYIAGALSQKEVTDRNPTKIVTDYLANVHKMCKVACQLRKLGYAPYVPALDFVIGIVNGDWTEEDYRGISDEFLPVCDAVLVISDSWGVQREIKSAKNFNIPVFYNIEALNKWVGY